MAGKDPQGSFLPTYSSPPSPSAFQESLGIVFWAWAYWEGILGGSKKEKRANVKARVAGVPGERLDNRTKRRRAESSRPVAGVDLLRRNMVKLNL